MDKKVELIGGWMDEWRDGSPNWANCRAPVEPKILSIQYNKVQPLAIVSLHSLFYVIFMFYYYYHAQGFMVWSMNYFVKRQFDMSNHYPLVLYHHNIL